MVDENSLFFGILNPKWISCKALYFFLFGGSSAFLPYVVPFYSTLGLSLLQISVVEFLAIGIGTITRPLIGSLADKTGKRNIIFGIAILLYMLPSTSMLFIYESVKLNSASLNSTGNISTSVLEETHLIADSNTLGEAAVLESPLVNSTYDRQMEEEEEISFVSYLSSSCY